MKIFITIVLSLCASMVMAQQRVTITGSIKSNKNEAVPNATVSEKGMPGNAVSAKFDGRFTLTLRGKSNTIIVTAIGYATNEVNVNGKTTIDITLVQNSKDMDEVVVVGYGTKKKINNTGAISSITGDEIRQTPSASLQNTLMGKVTGFTSQQRSGQPGSDGATFLIRGQSTITGSGSPLIILDDLEYNGSFSDIDPDQVESLTILKDAASTSVYGIKGANGVIVITTRRGKIGTPKLSVRSELAGQAPTFLPKFLDSYNSGVLRNQALANDGLALAYTAADLQAFKDGSDPYGHPNIDWLKILFRPFSLMSTNTFNITGGTDKTKYFISGGYLGQNGMVRDFSGPDLNSNYYYKRYNFRSNLDVQATKTLSLNLDLSGNYTEQNQGNIGGRNNRNNAFFEVNDYVQLPPFAYALYNPNGTFGANPSNGAYSNNIIGRFKYGGYNRSFDQDATANLRATQKLDFITPGLSVKGIVGFNGHYRFWRSMTRSATTGGFPAYGYDPINKTYTPYNPNVFDLQQLALGYYSDEPNNYRKVNWQGSLNYDHTFKNAHHFTGLALYNQTSSTTGTQVPILFKGFAFRVGYDYKQKYLLEASAGYNGTSLFSSEKRYAWFPSASAGWNVSKEPFFAKTFKFIDLFKLRASWGLVGTDLLGKDPATGNPYLYVYQQNYNSSGSYSIGNVSRTVNGIVEGTLGTNVTWEKEKQPDFGVDIKLFKSKLSITADYFQRERYDILITRGSVSTILGVGVPPVNLGRTQNNGYEIEVGYAGNIKKLNYSVRANISVAKNKILFQDEAQPAYPWLATTGHSINSLIGYTFTGFYKDTADVNNSPKTPITARPGDPKYADINGDGKIDVNDEKIQALTNLPNTILGFTGTLEYKGLSISFTLQSALNFVMRRNLTGNYTTERLDSWTLTNTNPLLPRLTTIASVGDYDSDFWFRRMDYLRLKSAIIGYQIPKKMLNKWPVSGIRVYASGYNLCTWMLKGKNIYDFDPEAPTSTEGGEYPVQKIVSLGVQVTF